MNTKPFPFYRYRHALEDIDGYLDFSIQHVDHPVMGQIAQSRYPHKRPEELINLFVGGGMEHLQAWYVANKGVVLHVADQGLIDACTRSTFPENLTLNDFQLPYPYIEVRYPKDSGLEPTWLINFRHPDYARDVNKFMEKLSLKLGHEVRMLSDTWNGAWIIATAEEREDAKEFVRSVLVDPTKPLWEQLLHSERSVASDEELETVRQASKVLLLSLLMRREELKGEVRQKRKSITGLPARIAKDVEKRPQYSVVPPQLFTPQQAEERYGSDGSSDRTVTPHWRQAHIRVLAHERFKRNPDGTPKVLLISPVAVHGGGKGERRV